MAIELEKIFNIDIRDYVEAKGNNLDDYDLIAVHFEAGNPNITSVEGFASIVPHGGRSRCKLSTSAFRWW